MYCTRNGLYSSVDTEIEEEVVAEELVKELVEESHILMLHNDDHNTFEHVIYCLCKYCDHNLAQAEQCAMIVHYNGKTDIKRGAKQKLLELKEILQGEGLTVSVV